MAARTKSRKRALDILYASEMRGQDPVAALDAAIADGEGPTNPYTETLVRGVTEHRARIDELLSTYSAGAGRSTGCRPSTAPRCGSASSSCSTTTTCRRRSPSPRRSPWCATLSTDDSPAFVNGVLGAMLRDRDSLTP